MFRTSILKFRPSAFSLQPEPLRASLQPIYLSALLITFSLSGFTVGVGAAALADQGVLAPTSHSEESSLPIYTPRNKIMPRARVGGSLRGTEGKDPEIVALVPDHVGMTIKKAPSLNWFLSKPTSLPIRFTLNDIRSVKPMHEGPIPTPVQAGIQSLNLKDLGLTLEPDVQYRWYISAIRDPDQPGTDIVAGGMIERCETSTCLITTEVILSCNQPSVLLNAKGGFWYDAMSCLCDLIKTDPQDASLRRMRAGLLKQVGLNGVAEWDLKSAPPER